MADREPVAAQSGDHQLSDPTSGKGTDDCSQGKRMRLRKEADDEGSSDWLQQPQHHQQRQQQTTSDGGGAGTSVLPCEGDADGDYFRCYSSIQVHEEMLSDTVRTNAYRWAILKNFRGLYQRCVVDVGAGTAILSVFAAQAGARKVYAIEASDMARHAMEVVRENKMADRIEVLQQRAEDVELPEKADVLISEWMGYCLFYESMLPSVLKARDKFLKPGGMMFPCQATLYLAPVHDEDFLHRLAMWREMKNMYKVSMDTMVGAAHACLTADADIRALPPEAVQAHAAQVCCVDLTSASPSAVGRIESPFSLRCFGHTTITGFVTWFTVSFPGGFSLSTSPYEPETHWGQTVLHLQHSFPVEQDTHIQGTFLMSPHTLSPRCMNIQLDFTVDSQEQHCQTFSLSHTYPGRSPREDSSAGTASDLP